MRLSAPSWTAMRVLFSIWLFRMRGNEVDAEDMVQETFLKAWKQIRRFAWEMTQGE
jgi:DNA-directed RNA polymerase specialized sigma24 family protein